MPHGLPPALPPNLPPNLPHLVPATLTAQAKPWWASRTLIVNAVALALVAAESQLQLLQGVLPVNVYALLAFVLPVVNAGLRLVTTMPVRVRAPDTTTISPGPGWPDLPPAPDAPPHTPQDKP